MCIPTMMRRNTKIMCVNAEHGKTQAKELPVSSQEKVAAVHDRPAACEGPGTCWDVTNRMSRCSFSPGLGIFIISQWVCECLMRSQ